MNVPASPFRLQLWKHCGLGVVCTGHLLLSSCNKSEHRPPQPTVAKEEKATRIVDKEDAPGANDYPLNFGHGESIISKESAVFRRIVEKVRSMEGGEEHEVKFAIELEDGGIEVNTRKIGASYGWCILLKLNEDGSVSIVEKVYWRT